MFKYLNLKNKNNNNSPKNNFYCRTCKIFFENKIAHDFTMSNKCPNRGEFETWKLIETIFCAEYSAKVSIEPDLTETLNLNEESQPNVAYFVTNHLYIKCPICLNYEENCVIQDCGHCLCKNCLITLVSNNEKGIAGFKCWLCRQIPQDYLVFKLG